jgi:hypothetical protein
MQEIRVNPILEVIEDIVKIPFDPVILSDSVEILYFLGGFDGI